MPFSRTGHPEPDCWSTPTDAQTGPTPQPGQRGQILIVEDEVLIAMDQELALRDAGHGVLGSASNGAAALRRLAEAQHTGQFPDLVLIDVRLKGEMDGIELAARIRDLYGDLPIIFHSGLNDPETRRRAEATHPRAFLVKPQLSKAVLREVEAALA
jgi:CheY-like chemotaxis protein